MTELIDRKATESRPASLKEIPVVRQWYGPVGKVLDPARFISDPLLYMQILKRRYGAVARLKAIPMSYTFALSPEYTRQILTNPNLFHSGDTSKYPFPIPADSALARISGTLNTINGEDHRRQRRLMMPAFQRKRVEGYRDAMVELTEQKLNTWQTNPGQPRNMLLEMKQLTMAVAVKTLLGLDPDRQGESSRQIIEKWVGAGGSILSFLLPLDWPGLPFHRILALSGQVESVLHSLIAERRERAGEGDDVLSALIAAHDEDGSRLSDQELIAQTLALFVAGHETTATALTWTLFMLSQHPQIAAELVEELESHLHGQAPTVEQVNELVKLDQVVKESMRILSPFVLGLRFNTEETALGMYRLPVNSAVVFSPLLLHHDPAIYPEPAKFRPERWASIDPSPYEYLPFSSGPRMCVGATFATLEIKLVLAMLLQRYRLALVPGAKIDRAGLFLTVPRGGMPMLVYPQDHHFGQNRPTGNIHQAVTL